MTIQEEKPSAAATATPNKDDKIIASIREQIAAATSDEERAIFEDSLKHQLAIKETGSSMRAPVAQTINPDSQDTPPKKEEEELGCCTKALMCIADNLHHFIW